ncbi:hypothetical protein GGI35DRAFT_476241 [Trichoderma velutinum]
MPQRWSSQEDKILREMVSIYLAEPVVNWIAVSNKLPGRSNKDCRKRWLKIQDHWRKGAWDEDEDLRLRLAYEAYGPKWIAIAAEVGTRNPDRSLGQGLLGYAQFPGGPPETDGVVIDHTAFGTMGTARAPFNLGRTTAHEIGHYLNCFHIWGDDRLMCTGSDQCEDTPNQAGNNRGKPTFPNISCNNGPNGDLFMNSMNYTDDAVCTMFTKGLVKRMDATLSGPRSSLVVSNFQEPILQTGTALHNTDDTFGFVMTDWNGDGRPDLVAIKKSSTGSNSTEVHILSGASRFQEFILQRGTALHNTDNTFDFTMTDWNGSSHPDLIAIKKGNTSSKSTEVHILSGASNFQEFIMQIGTALYNTDNTFGFKMTDWNGNGRPDLVAIKKSRTGSNSTEVHILAG